MNDTIEVVVSYPDPNDPGNRFSHAKKVYKGTLQEILILLAEEDLGQPTEEMEPVEEKEVDYS